MEDVLDVSRAQSGVQQAATLPHASRFIQSVCDAWSERNKAKNALITGINTAQSAIKLIVIYSKYDL